MTAAEILWRGIEGGGRRPFLDDPSGVMRYDALAAATGRWRALFDAHGVGPGGRVVLRTDDARATATFFLAALTDGVVPVVLAADAPDPRAGAIAAAVEAALVVGDPARDGAWAGGAPVAAPPGVGAGGLGGLLRRREAARPPRLPSDPEATAYVLFTSGTTSAPKGVRITQGNLAANLATLCRLFDYGPETRIFNDMALAHADGMIQGPVLAAFCGGAVLRAGGFSVPGIEDWLGRVRQARATDVIAVPTVWTLIDRYARHDDYFDAPELRGLQSVAAKLDRALWERLEARFGRPLHSHYGLTETVASALYAGSRPGMGARGTAGRPVDCEARLAGADAAGVGELHLRGANVFPGYWKAGAPATDAEGWLPTGDLARRGADGSYEIVGRSKTDIVSGGALIRPGEVDEAMAAHPAVQEAVTVGLPDADFGEIAVTAVILRAPASEADLMDHARAGLEALKRPKRIAVLEAIPRGLSGKPALDALRAALAGDAPGPEAAGEGVAEAVRAVAARTFRCDPATLPGDATPDDVAGWDSFSHVAFVMALEERFDIRIPSSQVAGMRSLGAVTALVERLG